MFIDTSYRCNAIPFPLGNVIYSEGVVELLNKNFGASTEPYLLRHKGCDWGVVSVREKEINDMATCMKVNEIVSKYQFCGEMIHIVTSSDRQTTRLMLSQEAQHWEYENNGNRARTQAENRFSLGI
ncbi:type I restriction endonuclease subunit M [Vibrio europaeus]|uniref:type I restriction endonuclease subunit M n=1 Tax=Vibrio europaeus TaxID=300876 RepID=UPI00233F7027|nr:type I restriction endonuclease subunit M [Vibrio europaeus]MDC5711169.1 type I restriction endonuclease subunit M [Vibrio europaeus]MDC5713198.1 type I restriction endonuclease subunit M [Vibrio europaeus]